MTAINYSEKLIQAMLALHTSLQLKDVLKAALNQITLTLDVRKVAILLCDNENLSLKLVSASGYAQKSLSILQLLSFSQDSVFQNVLKKRKPVAINNIRQAPEINARIMELEKSSLQMALPLIADNLMIGAMLIDDMPEPNPARLEFLRNFCQTLALALSQSITFEQSEFERQGLDKLQQILLELQEPLDTVELEELICNSALAISGTKHCALLAVQTNDSTLVLSNFKGFDGTSLDQFDLQKEGTLAGQALASGTPVYIADATNIQQMLPLSSRGNFFHSALAIPLIETGKAAATKVVIGILMLFSEESSAFPGNLLQLLEKLASHISARLSFLISSKKEDKNTIHDSSTGIYTPYFLQNSLQKEIERSQRHNHELALLRLDLDQMGHINEMLNSESGKRAVIHLAGMLRASLREIDIACRWDADGFAILLPETSRLHAQEVAERLRQRIRQAAIPGVGMVTVSIGIATYPFTTKGAGNEQKQAITPGSSGESESQLLLKRAEQALIVAKYSGKDTVRLAGELADQVNSLSWEQLVKEARLALINEHQARLESRLIHEGHYAPWMRAIPGWTGRKKSN